MREQLTSLFKVPRLYHFKWMNKQWLFQITELVSHSIHTFHIAHNTACFSLPLTYFHVRIVFNFPWVLQSPQEKWKTMLQNCGVKHGLVRLV